MDGSRASTWSPRDRVIAAIDCRAPDRAPVDFWAEPPAWNRLLAHFGHLREEDVLQALDVDVRHLNAIEPPEREVGDETFQNMWGERYVYRPTPWGPMREDSKGALAEASSFSELEAFDWPSVDDMDYGELADACRRHAPYALVYGFADVWQRPALVRGWENMFVDMVQRPEWVAFLSEKFADFYVEDYTRAAEVTGGRIDVYLIISDLGSQHGPLISPEMFRRFVAPPLTRMCTTVHGLGGKAMFHSCGDVRSFIPDLIACGVDVLDPIQPVSPNMRPEALKSEFGGRLCFHGGIDMQHLLRSGTPEQVAEEASRYCSVLGAGGGYIMGPAHLFQPDVPPENVVAMYAAPRLVAAD